MLRRVVQAFGLSIAVETDAPDLYDLLAPQLPLFPESVTPDAGPMLTYRVKVLLGGGATVMRGRRTIATVPDIPAASVHLVIDLQSSIARRAPGRTFVHAGVVAIRGRALLLPGRSHAGKSTLVAALLKAGARYGSDEFAVLDAHGRVHPYSRPVALRSPARRVPPGELGGETVTGSLAVGAILFLEYQEGAVLSLAEVSSGEVVLRLLQHCLGVRGRPAETMAALRAVASDARGFQGVRGEADDAAVTIVQRVVDGTSSIYSCLSIAE